jgi:DNA polymerase III subunit delta'
MTTDLHAAAPAASHAAEPELPSTSRLRALVGQPEVVAGLARTIAHADDPRVMTHAWLFTGPAGSGRSVAARAFAAELQAAGAADPDRQRALVDADTHPDVQVLATEAMTLAVADVRRMVREAQLSPSVGRWRIQIIEDADRMTEYTSNALLKSLEEPPERTVWMLCAPAASDLLPTIRSRVRVVRLGTPAPEAIAELLQRESGVDAALAFQCARAAQCHIGMARRLATNAEARQRRHDSLTALLGVRSLAGAMGVSRDLLAIARADADALVGDEERQERTRLLRQMGLGPDDTVPPRLRSQLREAEDRWKRRAKRALVDGVDRVLTDAQSLLRNALVTVLDPGRDLVNADLAADLAAFRARYTSVQLLRMIDAADEARAQLARNVSPALVLDAFLAALVPGVLA